MPTRQRTRTQDREYRTNAERARNATQLALMQASRDSAADGDHADRRACTGGTFADPFTDGGIANDSDPPPF